MENKNALSVNECIGKCSCGCSCSDGAAKIKSPVTALVYLETFFSKYDWETYKRTEVLGIPELDGMVNKFKVTQCDNAASWVLDFESKITPFLKKLEALGELKADIISGYNGEMTSALNSKCSLHKGLTERIKASVEDIFAALKADIESAERFGECEEITNDMRRRFNEAVGIYNVTAIDYAAIDEFPEVKAVKEKLDREMNKKLHDSGIDANATYEKAKELYNTQPNKINALRLFEAIRGYKDSENYIHAINEFFNFDSKLIKLVGKHFVLKKVEEPTFRVTNPKKAKKKKKDTPELPKIPVKGIGPSVSLYEVVDGKIYEPALVSGISYVLSYYGNKIFYIKRNRTLCSFDAVTRVETELDHATNDSYPCDKLYWNKDKTAFYIRKKLPAFKPVRGGCLRAIFSIFKKKPRYITDTKNNYSLLKVDEINNSVSVEIDRLVDITECYDNRLFYISCPSVAGAVSGLPTFMVCDLVSGEKSTVLGDDCHIHNVIGDTVIYSTWEPNEYNKMLFSYNLKTDVTTLIEANVFEYFTSSGTRVYYKVGNKKHAPMFSNNFEGTDRLEIMDNVKEVCAGFDNRIYLLVGKDADSTLFKMDGKSYVEIATDVDLIVSISASYTYYVDGCGNLHVVDNDGVKNTVITDDVDTDNIIVDRNYVYFLRHEPVGKDTSAASLYRVDLDGRNLKKLVFNAVKIQNYDDNSIYVHRSVTTKFVATEMENDIVKSEKTLKYKISRFSVLNKNTDDEEEIVVVGLPSEKTNVEKRGCLKKNISRSVSYRELSSKTPYRKPGIKKVGEIFTEQTMIENNNL